jgi:hypothetical protein
MRRDAIMTWVVYERHAAGKPKMTVVCEQSEWDALVLARPDDHVLVRSGIVNEGEAERLARSGVDVLKIKERFRPLHAADALPPGRDTEHAAVRDFWARAKRMAAAENPANAS